MELGVSMDLKLARLKYRDIPKAIRFAETGMHFDWYTDSAVALKVYGAYFWCLEKSRATQVLAAYDGDRLAGVLLCAMSGEKCRCPSLLERGYVRLADKIMELFYKDGPNLYVQTNDEMYAAYTQTTRPDGELGFLAADPKLKGKGVGSFLLAELERRERGKTVFLYTDDACTYEFYERRGFTRAQEKTIDLDFGSKQVRLRCFLYSKRLGE